MGFTHELRLVLNVQKNRLRTRTSRVPESADFDRAKQQQQQQQQQQTAARARNLIGRKLYFSDRTRTEACFLNILGTS